jgi:hypothetical protein
MASKRPRPIKPAPLREYKVQITPCSPGEHAIADPDDPANDGLKTKFGGTPDWIQSEEWQKCPECKSAMTFVAQIDSFEMESRENPNSRKAGEQDYMFGDVGMIYVFYCVSCATSASVVQYH